MANFFNCVVSVVAQYHLKQEEKRIEQLGECKKLKEFQTQQIVSNSKYAETRKFNDNVQICLAELCLGILQ